MKKNVKKIVITVGAVFLFGLCLVPFVPVLQWARPEDDSQDRQHQHAMQGAIIALNPPFDYSSNQTNRHWRLEKKTNTYTVVAKVSLRPEEPLVRLPEIPNIGTLIVGSLTPTNDTANPNKAAQQHPPQIVLHRSQKATVNGITFSGFQMEEARYDCFDVLHCAPFDVRGRRYDIDVVVTFADKRPDPAKVKIAAAEWRKILSSIRCNRISNSLQQNQ